MSSIPHTLRTARLLLRPWNAEDAPALAPILEANLAHLEPWIPAHVSTPAPVPELAARLNGFASDFADGRSFRYAMLTLSDSRVLGEAGMFPRGNTGRLPLDEADRIELGYWLDAAVTGRGFVTEAMRALLDLVAGIPRLGHAEIRCRASNVQSAAVPQRLGFHLAELDGERQVWQKAAR